MDILQLAVEVSALLGAGACGWFLKREPETPAFDQPPVLETVDTIPAEQQLVEVPETTLHYFDRKGDLKQEVHSHTLREVPAVSVKNGVYYDRDAEPADGCFIYRERTHA